jgi:uncharacterized oligopeptide transporter (OPT) family protein
MATSNLELFPSTAKEHDGKILVDKAEWTMLNAKIKQADETALKNGQERKAESLVFAVGVMLLVVAWMTSKAYMGKLSSLIGGLKNDAGGVSVGAIIVVSVPIAFFSVMAGACSSEARKIYAVMIEGFTEFKARRLDWFLEKPGGKHDNAITAGVLLAWTLFVALVVWARQG